jgi:hypothetical protein
MLPFRSSFRTFKGNSFRQKQEKFEFLAVSVDLISALLIQSPESFCPNLGLRRVSEGYAGSSNTTVVPSWIRYAAATGGGHSTVEVKVLEHQTDG